MVARDFANVEFLRTGADKEQRRGAAVSLDAVVSYCSTAGTQSGRRPGEGGGAALQPLLPGDERGSGKGLSS